MNEERYYRVPISGGVAIGRCERCSHDLNRAPDGSICILSCPGEHYLSDPSAQELTEQGARDLIASWEYPLTLALEAL